MSRVKRFRRLSALTSLLLTTSSPYALAQGQPQRPVPLNKAQCDAMTGDVMAVATEKLGVDAFVDYLKASNVDRKLDELCKEGNFAGAHAIATEEIADFMKPPEPNRVPQGAPGQCAWDGQDAYWSASAGAGVYTLAMFVDVGDYDEHALARKSSRFTIDNTEEGLRYRLEVPFKDGGVRDSVDVEFSVDGAEPARATVPIIAKSWANITRFIPGAPKYMGRHVIKVSADGKPLMTATFTPYPPGPLMQETGRQATKLKKWYDAGSCVKRQCFLTTACCEVIGLDDDCFELAALRRFRDRVMLATPQGRREVAQYYERAPRILAALEVNGGAARLLAVYATHILPCAVMATLGFDRATWWLYRDLVTRLENLTATAD